MDVIEFIVIVQLIHIFVLVLVPPFVIIFCRVLFISFHLPSRFTCRTVTGLCVLLHSLFCSLLSGTDVFRSRTLTLCDPSSFSVLHFRAIINFAVSTLTGPIHRVLLGARSLSIPFRLSSILSNSLHRHSRHRQLPVRSVRSERTVYGRYPCRADRRSVGHRDSL